MFHGPNGPGATLFLLAVLWTVLLAGCSGAKQVETLEERAQGIDRSLICPVCPGETINQSQVELAKQMRVLVREKLGQGQSKEEILSFFEERYGPMVLAEPPKEGFNLLIWVVPPGAIVLGSGLMLYVLRGMKRGSSNTIAQDEAEDKELQPYLALVDEELEQPQKEDSR